MAAWSVPELLNPFIKWRPSRLVLAGSAIGAIAIGAFLKYFGPFIYAGIYEYRNREEQVTVGRMTLTRLKGTDFFILPCFSQFCPMIQNFVCDKDDVWVCTFPKAGTTWAQEIVWLICHDADTNAAKKSNLEDRFPNLEHLYPGVKKIAKTPPPRYIKSHLPYGVIPADIWRAKCKVVYVARNPKDTSVSLYHFARLLRVTRFTGTFGEFFPHFTDSPAFYGGYWRHLRGFWRMREEPNVLFLFYEDMLKDTPAVIRKIANFFEKQLTEEQVQKIARYCSFDEMKQNSLSNMEWMKEAGFWMDGEGGLMRKGKVGDWKNDYTPEMSAEVDRLVEEKLTPLGIQFTYTSG